MLYSHFQDDPMVVVVANMRRCYDGVDEKEVVEGMEVYGEVAVARG